MLPAPFCSRGFGLWVLWVPKHLLTSQGMTGALGIPTSSCRAHRGKGRCQGVGLRGMGRGGHNITRGHLEMWVFSPNENPWVFLWYVSA